ncbi:MAG: bis(5'-nucleosyl)-tetraphosphatase (symmetrical) YqeK [Chloroflexi bacterium]|nr:bis(5'-nucleosyl)-tetraphosphatase (symmetrical) YqeK [Chloroflexota bacterium]
MGVLSPDNPDLKRLLGRLPSGLREHADRVREEALKLARIHQVDTTRVEVAALSHDLARGMKGTELLERARSYGLELHPAEQRVTVLLHGPVGAEMLRRECGIEDQEVLEAVRWHSTFHRELGPVAKVVFLADKLDHQKRARYPFLDRVDALARDDLDAAVLAFLDEELVALIRDGKPVHPASIEGRNGLLESQRVGKG